MTKSLFSLFLTICIALSLIAPVDADSKDIGTRIRILDLENSGDPIGKYATEVLRIGLKKSDVNYRIEKNASVTTPQVRLIQDMANNRGDLDLIWTMTSDERESQLLPIRIPIDKGLMGWRIAFINPDLASRMRTIKGLDDLSKLKAGQGYFWPDTAILRHNGLTVITGNADTLPGMLIEKRFDYFPRSIIEIWNEKTKHAELAREIDQAIVLHYPTALYFFVAPSQKKLAEDLQRGLELAIKDGSFEQLFNKYCRPFVLKADLKNRRILELKNPLIKDASIQLHRPELWYRP